MEEEELKWGCLCSFAWNPSKVHGLPKAGVLEGGAGNHWKARCFIHLPSGDPCLLAHPSERYWTSSPLKPHPGPLALSAQSPSLPLPTQGLRPLLPPAGELGSPGNNVKVLTPTEQPRLKLPLVC